MAIGTPLRKGACALLAGGACSVHVGGSSAVALHSAAQADARSGTARWEQTHGPDGGPVGALAVAPGAPTVVYAGTARGVFRSSNAGGSWTAVGPAGRTIVSLAVDPRAPRTIFAASSDWIPDNGIPGLRQELFKSVNGGRSWRALGEKAWLVAVAPAGPRTVYAVLGRPFGKTTGFVKSVDGGATWQPADRGLPSTHPLVALALDPVTPGVAYAAIAGSGIFKSIDAGESWQATGSATGPRHVSALAVEPHAVYASADGVLRSIDGGETWARVDRTMVGNRGISSLAVDSNDPGTVFAVTYCGGVYRSADGGRSWRVANTGLVPQCPLSTAALALDPRRPGTVYAASPGAGVLRSTNGGVLWQAANSGLSLTTIPSLAVDPLRGRTLYAGAGGRGLFESADGGGHWLPVTTGLGSVQAVALDPADTRVVLAAGAGRRLVRSEDGGRTWQPAARGIRGKRVSAVALRHGRAYAATPFGLFASSDAGRSWHGHGPAVNMYVQTLAISPDDPDVAYAASLGSDARGLYRTTDGGGTWERLTDALPERDITALALDPRTPTPVYIDTGDGVFKSTDRGDTWRPSSAGLPRITVEAVSPSGAVTQITMTAEATALAVDPAQPSTLYAATAERGVYRSTNAGASWRPLNAGLSVRHIDSLGVDATGSHVYAGTEGAGVVALSGR